jgi:hypothetical protein
VQAVTEYQQKLTSVNAAQAAKTNTKLEGLSATRREARANKLGAAALLPIPEDPPVMATIFGVAARPELNGMEVQVSQCAVHP